MTAVDFESTTPGLLSVKLPGEAVFIDADFSAIIPSDWTLTGVVTTMEVLDGPGDASATAMLDGTAAVSGLVSSQRVIAGVAGNDYLLTFKATATKAANSQSPFVQFILPVRSVRLG
jgi:hypothetical protein